MASREWLAVIVGGIGIAGCTWACKVAGGEGATTRYIKSEIVESRTCLFITVGMLLVSVAIAWKLRSYWASAAVILVAVALHPAWTVDPWAGDCGMLQLELSAFVVNLAGACVLCQTAAWIRQAGRRFNPTGN